MKAKIIGILVTLSIVAPLLASVPARTAKRPAEGRVRFAPVHIYLDSRDKPLAAYQFELVCSVPARAYSPGEENASRRHRGPQTQDSAFGEPRYEHQIKIVGVEGGAHPAFREAPYYDPAALMNDRIIIAAFNTGRDLPHGRTRIATIHLQILGDTEPQYELKLVTAADQDGQEIRADLNLQTGESK